MRLDWWTLGLQTINFAILVWLLNRFLYKPVQRMIEARKSEIARQFEQARALQDKARAELATIETEHAGMAAAREAALESARTQAQQLAEARRAQAEHDAQALLAETRGTLAGEREQALAEAERLALDLAAQLALRLLAEVPVEIRAEAWIARIEQYFMALSAVDRTALARQLSADRPLSVVTAIALPAATAEAWEQRLRKLLGEPLAVAFEVNADLVAGAELHFPDALLHFSWQTALEAARTEAAARANTR
jgi:F-type H+-transporting ATPase subunit b